MSVCLSQCNCYGVQAVQVSRVLDRDGNRRLKLALANYSWRVRAHNLCEGPHKPSIQQIQLMLKEVLIPSL